MQIVSCQAQSTSIIAQQRALSAEQSYAISYKGLDSCCFGEADGNGSRENGPSAEIFSESCDRLNRLRIAVDLYTSLAQTCAVIAENFRSFADKYRICFGESIRLTGISTLQ